MIVQMIQCKQDDTLELSGGLWVNCRATPVIERRLRATLKGDDWSCRVNYLEKALNHFVTRSRALEARR